MRTTRADAGRSDARRGPPRWALVLSFALHLALIAVLLPWAVDPDPGAEGESELAGEAGGSGFAEDITIRASREAVSGAAGRSGADRREASAPPTRAPGEGFEVVMLTAEQVLKLTAPPTPDEAEIRKSLERPSEFALKPRPPRPRPAPEPQPQAAAPAPEATRNDSAISEGGSGNRTEGEAGSPASAAVAGAGAGNSTRPRTGNFLSGGQIRDLVQGFTLIGSEGNYDGSINNQGATRYDIPWRVYYAPDGAVEARFTRWAAPSPHRPQRLVDFSEDGRWTIEGDLLCQRIEKVGYGTTICFEVHRDGDQIAMYYAECGALSRCYRGRLGPRGRVVPGRALN